MVEDPRIKLPKQYPLDEDLPKNSVLDALVVVECHRIESVSPRASLVDKMGDNMSGRIDCIFCHVDSPILAETKLSFAILDHFPVSDGHTLIIPKRHVKSIWEMTPEEFSDAFTLVRQIKEVVQEKFKPQGFNVGVNCGEAAGQTVFHAHIHLIPRYTADVPSPRGGVRNIIPGKGDY
jgi:diadenosine tetraphosphate (Ap4A) HIT family hydrolase